MVFEPVWPSHADDQKKPLVYFDRASAQIILVKTTFLQEELAASLATLTTMQQEVAALEEEVKVNKSLVATLEAEIVVHLKKEAIMQTEIDHLRDQLADAKFWSTIRTYAEIAGVVILSGIFIYASGK